MCAGLARDLLDLALGKLTGHLIFDVFFKAPHYQIFIGKVTVLVIGRIGDGSGVEHVHQAGEALWLAIMRGGREHDQCVTAPSQQFSELAAQ
ncbi:hypothetical protein D3C72_2158740 [compost metagenome]